EAAGERTRSGTGASRRARPCGGGAAAGAARGRAAGERRGLGGNRSSAGRGGAAPEQRTGPPMKFDRRLLTHFEWVLPLLSLAVSALGVTTVYSATHAPGAAGWSPLAVRQLAWLAASVAVMLAVLAFDYRRLDRSAYFIYLLVLLAVLAVPVLGRIGGGSRRWIRVGPASIQPSEFMKLALVLVLARHFSRTPGARLGLRELVVPLVLTAFPAAAILAQPDLGTGGVLGVVSRTMLVLGGVQLRSRRAGTAPRRVVVPL